MRHLLMDGKSKDPAARHSAAFFDLFPLPDNVRAVLAGTLLAAGLVASAPHTAEGSQDESTTQAAAIQDFQQRLEHYLDLRNKLSARFKALSVTADATELATRQAALASALQKARTKSKPGDLIPPPVAAHIGAAVAADLKRRSAADHRAILEDVANGPRLILNTTYPEAAALPTLPALLLNKLPQLPDNLQYRFYERHIVVLDGDAEIIIDYIPNVLPPH